MASNNNTTQNTDFCSTCGAILPLLKAKGTITCYLCPKEYTPEALNSIEQTYELHFNSKYVQVEKNVKTEMDSEGTLVERRCPRCGHDRMSYETLQLRSADEGQTVFYTCVSCKFKDTENS